MAHGAVLEQGIVTPEAEDVAGRTSGIVRDGLDVWVTYGKRLHDRSIAKRQWSPEDIIGDTTDLMEHLTPLVERSIQLSLDVLRPWAVKYQERAEDG